jgi:hypothetical protein
MTLDGEQLRLLVLNSLVDCADGGCGLRGQGGVRPDQIEALRNLAAGDLAALARMRDPEISFQIDPLALDHGLRALNYVRQRKEVIDYFIRNGATVSMLVTLFKLAPMDVAKYRTVLGVKPGSRPRMPSAKQREAVCARWFAIRAGHEQTAPTVEDYRALHREFSQLSLATLYAVINEFAG